MTPEISDVLGVEIFSSSSTYEWEVQEIQDFRRVTLLPKEVGGIWEAFLAARGILHACLRFRADVVFLCHYERSYIFMSALVLRALGKRLVIMNDSKFDDYPRYLSRELLKRLLYLPYSFGLTASDRGKEYFRFLGLSPENIFLGYDNISNERVRSLALSPPAPEGVHYTDRSLLCVARLVEKKNHWMLLQAYERYRQRVTHPRRLVLCGAGPLEQELRSRAKDLGLEPYVDFLGHLGAAGVARELAKALCLILPSSGEQFGIVVLEAQALGLPVIVSVNCGARDQFVRTGVNGFVVESDNPEGLSQFMALMSEEEASWAQMCRNAAAGNSRGDVSRFAEAVLGLCRLR